MVDDGWDHGPGLIRVNKQKRDGKSVPRAALLGSSSPKVQRHQLALAGEGLCCKNLSPPAPGNCFHSYLNYLILCKMKNSDPQPLPADGYGAGEETACSLSAIGGFYWTGLVRSGAGAWSGNHQRLQVEEEDHPNLPPPPPQVHHPSTGRLCHGQSAEGARAWSSPSTPASLCELETAVSAKME